MCIKRIIGCSFVNELNKLNEHEVPVLINGSKGYPSQPIWCRHLNLYRNTIRKSSRFSFRSLRRETIRS